MGIVALATFEITFDVDNLLFAVFALDSAVETADIPAETMTLELAIAVRIRFAVVHVNGATNMNGTRFVGRFARSAGLRRFIAACVISLL